ncbi:MAG: hypothetical protein HC901_01050 [Bdellovibrionaceae bacterium]|nr:hypothetical protein [Pseudobdellovibrionaceae bacterium]
MFIYGKTAANAIAIMSYLAADPGRRAGSLEIAKSRRISRPLTAKLLTQLASAGLVSGQPGPGGGYTIARKPSTISLFDIVSLFEQTGAPRHLPLRTSLVRNRRSLPPPRHPARPARPQPPLPRPHPPGRLLRRHGGPPENRHPPRPPERLINYFLVIRNTTSLFLLFHHEAHFLPALQAALGHPDSLRPTRRHAGRRLCGQHTLVLGRPPARRPGPRGYRGARALRVARQLDRLPRRDGRARRRRPAPAPARGPSTPGHRGPRPLRPNAGFAHLLRRTGGPRHQPGIHRQ